MRLAARWHEVGLAGLILFTACTMGDRPITSNDPRTAGPQMATASDAGILVQEGFEDNAFASRGWYDNTGIATTTAQHVTGSTRALEAHFALGATTPTWGGAARHLFPATPTLYVSYWVKYSANWVGSGQNYHPHEFQIRSDLDGDWAGPSDTYLTAYIEHNYRNGGIPRLALQDAKNINTAASLFRTGGATIHGTDPVANTEARSIGGANGGIEDGLYWENFAFSTGVYYNDKWLTDSLVRFQPSAGPGYQNQWNHVEVYFAMNSIVGGVGQHDGVMQYWFNGVLVLDRRDILFRTGAHPDLRFHQFLINPYIGDGSPADQYMWVDDLTLAAGRPSGPSGVASVVIAPSAAGVAVGGTAQYTATLRDASGNILTGQLVTWASTDPAVATVNQSGLATAVAAGAATISATSGGATGTATLSVTAPVASVVVTPSAVSQNAGATQQLVATLRDGSGNVLTGRTVVWTSSAPAVATVNASGLETAVAAGTATITATSEGKSGTATATVTSVTAPVASVVVTPSAMSQNAGATQQLVATLRDGSGNVLTGRTVVWTSSAPAVATVNASGLETAVAAGTATITATSEGKGGTATVTVTGGTTNPGAVTNLSVVGTTSNSITLSFAEVNDGSGQPASYDIRWASGTITWWSAASVAQGTCQVPLTGTVIGTTRSCTVLGLTPSTTYQFQLVAFRGTLNVKAVFGPLSNVVTGATAAAALAPVASVTVAPASASVTTAQTVQLTATPRDAGGNALTGRVVTWSSNNTAVATVNTSGRITGVAAGSATITATSEGKSGTSAITVTVAPVAPVATVSVSPALTSVAVGGTVQLAVTLRDASGNVLSGRVVTWSSNATSVATVSVNGLVTALVVGSATITATSEGQSGTAAITVAATPPGGQSGHANQPAGFTPIFERLFNSLPGTAGSDLVGSSVRESASNLSIIADPTGPKGGNSLQMTWPSGLSGGDSPSRWDFWGAAGPYAYTPKFNEVYIESYLKCPSADFLNNQVGTKLWYMSYGGDGSFNLNDSFMLLGKYQIPSAPMSSMSMDYHSAEVDDRETSDPTQGSAQPRYENMGGGKKFTCGGNWNHIEVYMNLGTPNNRNGVLRVWIDGIKVTEYTNIKYLDTDFNYTHGFYHGEWTPVWGGSGPARTRSDIMYLNYFYVSGR